MGLLKAFDRIPHDLLIAKLGLKICGALRDLVPFVQLKKTPMEECYLYQK